MGSGSTSTGTRFSLALIAIASLFTVLAFIIRIHQLQASSCFIAAVALSLIAFQSKKLVRDFFIYGFIIHLVAFYWLPDTLKVFGGFNESVAWAVHILFAATAAVQWIIVGFLTRKLRSFIGTTAFPIAYLVTDMSFPQLFPWSFANPLISFHPLSALAEFYGSKGVSFLLLLLVTTLVATFLLRQRKSQIAVEIAILVVLGLGFALDERAKKQISESVPIRLALVQGNISLEDKSSKELFSSNLAQFRELSKRGLEQGAEVVVWPETTNEDWTPNRMTSIRGTHFDPTEGMEMNLLYGLLSYEGRRPEELKTFNAAFLVGSDGSVQGRYAKRVLMPFGEFLPFERYFPWLRDISPMTGKFEAGITSAPLELQLSDKIFRPAVLICYEDLVPLLTRESVNAGANILVNITNDAWYGDTASPWQHTLLASWRTIESRRALVRSTNTGITTIVSPRGDMLRHLDTFKKDILVDEAPLLNVSTLYSQYGDLPLIGLALLTTVVAYFVNRKNN